MIKKQAYLFAFIIAVIALNGYSKNVTLVETKAIAETFVNQQIKSDWSFNKTSEIWGGGELLAYVFEILPQGYVVVSANTILSPIPAYSFESGFGEIEASNTLYIMLTQDLSAQIKIAERIENRLTKDNEAKWAQLKGQKTNNPKDDFQQWPSNGNGWLKTNWTQTAPYSNFCPIDPVTTQRSYTGCPATAMSQILNFHGSINGTRFNNNDDYYHNYSGRQFNIDDDYALHGFPSFQDLNYYLDTLQAHWDFDILLTNNDKAALNFACGVAAKQVFSSEGSGTYSVSQAHDAYIRFGCNSALLLQYNDTSLVSHLMQNMKDTLPAHLAIVDAGWTTGHNVVVDGYNTDGYFHVNFGWGGSSNGWYLLPQELPMNLTSFEGVVVDIMKDMAIGLPDNASFLSNTNAFPNPCNNVLNISCDFATQSNVVLKIWDITGILCFNKSMYCDKSGIITVDLSGLNIDNGVLMYQLSTDKALYSGKVIKLPNN